MGEFNIRILKILIITLSLIIILEFLTVAEIGKVGKVLETPENIHRYMILTNLYKGDYFPNLLSIYWKTRIGDCTEIMNTERIMLKANGYKTKICRGTIDGIKHDYVKYYDDGWKQFDDVDEEVLCITL